MGIFKRTEPRVDESIAPADAGTVTGIGLAATAQAPFDNRWAASADGGGGGGAGGDGGGGC